MNHVEAVSNHLEAVSLLFVLLLSLHLHALPAEQQLLQLQQHPLLGRPQLLVQLDRDAPFQQRALQLRQLPQQEVEEPRLQPALPLRQEGFQHLLHQFVGGLSALVQQGPEDADEALSEELVVLSGLEEQEGPVVLRELLQLLAAHATPVEDPADELLDFLWLLEEEVLGEVVDQWREVLGLFNKEQQQPKHPAFEGLHALLGWVRVRPLPREAGRALGSLEKGESLVDILHVLFIIVLSSE